MSVRSKFKVDIASGVITRFYNNTAVASSLVAVFYSRDKLPIEVLFTNGNSDITSDVLPTGAELRIGLRRYTGTGAILAQSTDYTIVSGAAQTILDLDTAEMVTYMDALADSQNEKPAYLEFEVTSADGTTRCTIAQMAATIRCEVNMQGDVPPESAAASADAAAASATAAAASAAAAASSAAAAAAALDEMGEGGITWVAVPATAATTGTAGQMARDDSYLYVCTATDTWTRTPLSEW